MKRYQEKLEKEYDLNPLSESFLIRHDEIDSELQQEKKRVRKINRYFLVCDVIVFLGLLIAFYLFIMTCLLIRFLI